ncbi:RagB/SusD family nutrient uptake outer membrane protein, partial [Flavobacterium hauense]
LVDFVPTIEMKLPRSTNGEIYALINGDLDFAFANINEGLVSASPRTGASKRSILALRARMAAYRGQYEAANGFVDQISTSLTLANQAQYRNMFRQNTDLTEVIWKLERTVSRATGNFSQYWSSVNSTITGSPFLEVSTALFNELVAGDVRREVVIDPTASTVGFAIRPIGKYSESETQLLLGDIMVFRNSEMRLLKAEYYASISDFPNVATQINFVRRSRFNNTSNNIAAPTSQQDAWAAVLKERRIELAFEGHRYVDLRRLGKKAGVTVDREEIDYQFNNAFTIPIDDIRWTMPIPRPEQAANPNIQQNPGYGAGGK